MAVLQADRVELKTMRQLIIRTEFILQNNLEDDFVYFLECLLDDPEYQEFNHEINEDIGITDAELDQTMQQLFII